MGFTVTSHVAAKNRLSLFHANSNSLLEMHSLDCLHQIRDAASRNLCIEPSERFVEYRLEDGGPKLAAERKTSSLEASAPEPWAARERAGIDYARCPDFTESLEFYLRVHAPPLASNDIADAWRGLIDFVDRRGFLHESPRCVAESIGAGKETVLALIESMKQIEPGGIGSFDLADFLRFQLSAAGRSADKALTSVLDHLEELASLGPDRLARRLDLSPVAVGRALRVIRELRPYPTWGLFTSEPEPGVLPEGVSPDLVYVRRANGERVIGVTRPGVELGVRPEREARESDSSDTGGSDATRWSRELKDQEKEALELAALLENRHSTIVAVSSQVVRRQLSYLDGETDCRAPLTVSQVADELGMQVSTVSRAIKNMTISTPRGTMRLRELLSRPVKAQCGATVSGDYVQSLIMENLRRPNGKRRSDPEIAELLASEGIPIARRTVNKYRRKAAGGLHGRAARGGA